VKVRPKHVADDINRVKEPNLSCKIKLRSVHHFFFIQFGRFEAADQVRPGASARSITQRGLSGAGEARMALAGSER
jgi:hypothetical protein